MNHGGQTVRPSTDAFVSGRPLVHISVVLMGSVWVLSGASPLLLKGFWYLSDALTSGKC